MKLVTHMLDHGGEEMEDLGIAGILRICLVVVDEQLQRGQELLIKDQVLFIVLFENVGLNEL